MISLFIDTSHSRLIVSIVDETKMKLLSIYDEILKNDLSVKIFEVITDSMNHIGVFPDMIDKIYISTGPGSFTGIRIGITIAKTYAWSLNKTIIPVSSLEVLASSSNSSIIVPVIDARRDFVYAGIYDKDLNVLKEDSYISTESLIKDIESKDYQVISDDEISYFPIITKPEVDILKIIKKHKNDIGMNPHEVNPRYLKVTEAEAKLNKND